MSEISLSVLSFISFFSFSLWFFLSLKITTKNIKDLTFHSFFLFLFLVLKSARNYGCWLDTWSAFFSFFDVARYKSYDSFFLSFLFTLIFSFFKDYNKKHQRSHHLFFLSSFLLFLSFWNMSTDTQNTCVLYY